MTDRREALIRLGSAGLVAASGGLLSSVPTIALAQATGQVWTPQTAPPQVPKWPQPGEVRQIWIKRQGSPHAVIARYFDGEAMRMKDYMAACHVLRDVRANETAYIDVELLDLIFAMQKWLVQWGIDVPMTINSGYRSKKTNNNTEGAAKKSMHLLGRAADIAIEGIPTNYLGRLAAILGKGGVGFYVGSFIHIDTGAVRYWGPRR